VKVPTAAVVALNVPPDTEVPLNKPPEGDSPLRATEVALTQTSEGDCEYVTVGNGFTFTTNV
jgi:hypothetical protein